MLDKNIERDQRSRIVMISEMYTVRSCPERNERIISLLFRPLFIFLIIASLVSDRVDFSFMETSKYASECDLFLSIDVIHNAQRVYQKCITLAHAESTTLW